VANDDCGAESRVIEYAAKVAVFNYFPHSVARERLSQVEKVWALRQRDN